MVHGCVRRDDVLDPPLQFIRPCRQISERIPTLHVAVMDKTKNFGMVLVFFRLLNNSRFQHQQQEERNDLIYNSSHSGSRKLNHCNT